MVNVKLLHRNDHTGSLISKVNDTDIIKDCRKTCITSFSTVLAGGTFIFFSILITVLK